MQIRDHIRLLAILNIVMGCLTALLGIVVLVVMGGAAGVIGAALAQDPDTARISAPIIAVAGMAIAIFFLILALPSVIGGWGLLHFRPWARILIIIVSILHLLHFPLGTALGVYGLWVLLGNQGRALFEGPAQAYVPGGAYPPPASPAAPPPYPPPPPRT
ncbi:MAG: hypothetical protein JO091_05555 [Acidobacteriaceae bacterium]|nr:hypothetical protein [Acidobacteriaceae bacterium]